MTGLELTPAFRLAPVVASAIARARAPKPGARTVDDAVRVGRRTVLRRPRAALDEADVRRLADALTVRLTRAHDQFAELEPDEGAYVLACVTAVLDTNLTMDDIQAARSDPALLRAQLTARTTLPARNGPPLRGDGADLHDILLDACCAQLVEHFTARPEFVPRTLVEQSRDLGEVLRRLPDLDAADREFAERYAAGLRVRQDRTETLGAVEAEPEERSYRLTTAYVSLAVDTAQDHRSKAHDHSDDADPRDRRRTAHTIHGSLESVLARHPRLLMEGPAGSGKTTLLKHLAIHIIDGDLPVQLDDWRGRVPFIVRIRSLLRDGALHLPGVADLVAAGGSQRGDGQPPGWASRVLDAGAAVVLVDGLDELPRQHHEAVLDWLYQLCHDYPDAAYLLTSRPRVLTDDGRRVLHEAGFGSAELQPMNRAQVAEFIQRWHHTQALHTENPDARRELDLCGQDLNGLLDTRRDLARLATNPLLCALICVLHRSADRALPNGRTPLYQAALAMMLGRREQAREVPAADHIRLSATQQEALLGALAMWMTLNGRRSISREMALQRVEEVLRRFPPQPGQTPHTPADVLRVLEQRTGLLQQPMLDELEFRHASFQDYLAAGEMIAAGNLDHLLRHTEDPLYHDVLIMGVGRTQHDRARQRYLLDGLITRADAAGEDGGRLWLLAAACIADLDVVDPEPAERIYEATRQLIPPDDIMDAHILATAGEFVLDLLGDATRHGDLTERQAIATIATAEVLATDSAIPLLRSFVGRREADVRQALVYAWLRIPDAERFFVEVVSQLDLADIMVELPDFSLLSRYEGFFTSITDLRLATGTTAIPADDLVKLPNLTTLILPGARVDDASPLAAFTNLTVLHLDDTPVCNVSPLASLTKLTELLLNNTRVRDLSPLSGLNRLSRLVLDDSQVSDLSPLATLTNLYSLDLDRTRVFDLSPLAALTNLTALYLNGTPVADLSPLAGMTGLNTLDVSSTRVTDLSPLARLTGLTQLEISDTAVADLSPLAGLSNLTELILSNTQVTDVSPLANLTKLTTLELHGTHITDMTPLAHLTNLTVRRRTG
ncbi:NACHT domain-containing protein [Yinghuangia sp. YIM S09857]|uniref:NACHT domain-containing protein n=1 Tax=Yinghuangia sp. YIM S09857 TaxID=3436929 RepID=UPI003F53E50A